MSILTDAVIKLSGSNTLWGGKNITPVDQCAILIKTQCKVIIEGTGSLTVKMSDGNLTADTGVSTSAIGSGFTASERVSLGTFPSPCPYLAGGDLIIKSGTIHATGTYHGAGIGQGHFGAMRSITIVGGNVTSIGGYHGSGIGGGCYASSVQCSLVVLPPTIINASSANADINPVGGGIVESSGMLSIFYMGDPAQKKLRVTAQQRGGSALTGRQNVNILFDVSGDATISSALRLANLNPARWFAGSTGTQGFWETTGKLVGNVKVYSDTPTQQTPTAYYSSKRVSVPGTSDVHIILEEPDMSTPWLLITQDKTAWTNSDITLTVRHNPAIPYLTRMRPQGGTWVTGVTSITSKVSTNGTYYFEVENEDGNVMTVSHKVSNIDKAKPIVNVN